MAETSSPVTTPRVKGPLVWLDMDQQELDDAYDQTVYAPNQPLLAKRRAAASESVLKRFPPERVAYGPSEHEKLDIYKTQQAQRAGECLRPRRRLAQRPSQRLRLPRRDVCQRRRQFRRRSTSCKFKTTGGNLLPMAQQVRSAVAWVYKNAARFGADANRVYITGHSSGAHLSGCALVTDWQKDFGLPPDIIKGGLLISGMYDLQPVRLSKRSEYVKFTDEVEQALSSQRHLDKLHAPITVCYGTQETPEFQRQSRDFAAAVKAAGKPVELLVGESLNHFEMQETLGNPYGIGGRAALKMMNLSI